LRAELLFNLAFLAAAAIVLSLFTATLLRVASTRLLPSLAMLVTGDLAVFLLLGRYLINRHVLHPIEAAVE
jgi:hypothetical protein